MPVRSWYRAMSTLIAEDRLPYPAWCDGIETEHRYIAEQRTFVDILYAISNDQRKAVAWRVCNARADHYTRSSWYIDRLDSILHLSAIA